MIIANRVLLVVTDALSDTGLVDDLRDHLLLAPTEVMVVAPAVEQSLFHQALGERSGGPLGNARRRMESALAELRRHGVAAMGQVGDSDPITAAEKALRQTPADEVLIVAHAKDQARWFEDGLFERAQETLYPAIRMYTIRRDIEAGETELVDVQRAGPGRLRRSPD